MPQTQKGRDGNRDHGIKPLTVIHVVSSLDTGGMERVVLGLASAQQAAGLTVGILAIKGGALEREAAQRNLRVETLSGGRVHRITQAMRYFAGQRPDVVHVHNATSLQYGVLSRFVSSARVVVTMHGDLGTQARIGTPLEWWFTSASVAVSTAAALSLRLPRTARPVTVVRNGIAVPPTRGLTREHMRTALGLGDSLVGIMVARIDGRKGHATLLKSLCQMNHAKQDAVRVLIVGDGRERPEMERLAQTLSLDHDRVRFLGSRSDIDELLDAADFFLLPSDTEGLPLSILEAMAHGLPIVATRVGGIPEIVEHEREGLLIPPEDPVALADAIERLHLDDTLRRAMGAQARLRAETELSLAETVKRYSDVYESTLSASAP